MKKSIQPEHTKKCQRGAKKGENTFLHQKITRCQRNAKKRCQRDDKEMKKSIQLDYATRAYNQSIQPEHIKRCQRCAKKRCQKEVCQRDAKEMPKRCQRDVKEMPKRCQGDAKEMPKRCQRDVKEMSKR